MQGPASSLVCPMKPNRSTLALIVSATLAAVSGLAAETPAAAASLAGTWTLAAADDLRPDGTRVPAYGADPQGLLILGADGRYSLQLYRNERVKFASGNKRQGSPGEYEAAVLRMSSHFGRYVVDTAARTITFQIEFASFPNWDRTEQKRPFELKGDELSYRVPTSPDGTVPISVWRRVR